MKNIEIITEDDIVQEDLDNRSDTYRDIYDQLVKYTNNFTKESGSFPLQTATEYNNAVKILKDHYNVAKKDGLDYERSETEGTDYRVKFSDPKDVDEALDTDELKFMPAYAFGNLGESMNEAKHDELNPKLWENEELKPEVKEKLEEIVQKFDDNLKQDEVELDVKDIVIIGSNANYNYNNTSDIDLHIVADTSVYSDQKDLAMKCYQAYKSLFNNKYDPTIYGCPVEIYVEPDAIHANSNGMYSLKDCWLKAPKKEDVPEVDQELLDKKLEPFLKRFDEADTIEKIDSLIDDIYLQRQQGILKDGEYSIDNQVFKAFRSEGYLDKLKEKKVELENDEMSLESLKEGVEQVVQVADYEGAPWSVNAIKDGDDYYFDLKNIKKLNRSWSEDESSTKIYKKKGQLYLYSELDGEDFPIEQKGDLYKFPIEWNWVENNMEENRDDIMHESLLQRLDEAFSPFEELRGKPVDEILKAIQGYCVMNKGVSFARVVNTELSYGVLEDVKEINLGNGEKLIRQGNGFELERDGKHIWTGTAASAASEIAQAYIGKDDTYAEELKEANNEELPTAYTILGHDEDGYPIDVSPWQYFKEYGVDGQTLYETPEEAIAIAKEIPEAEAVLKVHYEGETGLVNAMIWDEPDEAEVVWTKEKDESLTEAFEELDAKKIAEDIEKVGADNQIYPELEDYSNGPMGSAICSFFVSGDWKHEHRRFELLVDEYCENNDLVVFNSSNEEVGESDDDSYKSVHTFYIINKEDEDTFNGMRRAFSGDESLEEANADKTNKKLKDKEEARRILDIANSGKVGSSEAQRLRLLAVKKQLGEDVGDEFIGKKVRIVNLSDVSPADFGIDDNATEDEIADYEAMMAHEGEIATITNCVDQVENHDLEGYWDVEFEDGYEIPALSDYHMELVEDESLNESYVIAITDYDPDQITYVGGDDAEHSANGEVNIKDALKFASKEEAQEWIDSMYRAYEASPDLTRFNYEIQKLDEAVLGSLDTPEEKDAAKRAFARQERKEADAKNHAEYKKNPSKFDIKADEELNEADVNGNTMTIQDVHAIIEDFLNGCHLIEWDCTDDHFDIDYSEEALQLCANDDVREMFESGIGIDIEQFEDVGEADNIIEVSINYGSDMAADGQEEYFNYTDESNDKHRTYLLDTLDKLVSDDAVKYNIEETNKEFAEEE